MNQRDVNGQTFLNLSTLISLLFLRLPLRENRKNRRNGRSRFTRDFRRPKFFGMQRDSGQIAVT